MGGDRVSYREAGSGDDPALRGFPSCSHTYRDLVQGLSNDYRPVAPDSVGFGNGGMPTVGEFDYGFDRLSRVVGEFVGKLGLRRFGLWVQDYDAPVGSRIAARHPEWVEALIAQNAVAYEGGLREDFGVVEAVWENRNQETERGVKNLLTPESAGPRYTSGARDRRKLDPGARNMDRYFLTHPGNAETQVELQYDYRNNPPRYPEWQAYLREHQPPTLVIWVKDDLLFAEEGARACERDPKSIEVHLSTPATSSSKRGGRPYRDASAGSTRRRSPPGRRERARCALADDAPSAGSLP